MASPWDEEYDVVVAGSGAAGCAAALGAWLAGSRSILICEKSPKMSGGTTRMAGGGWVWSLPGLLRGRRGAREGGGDSRQRWLSPRRAPQTARASGARKGSA